MIIRTLYCCSLLLLGAYASASASSWYDEEKSFVEEIFDIEQFEEDVIESNNIWMMQFYDPTNKECEKFEKSYNQLAGLTTGIFRVGAVDVTSKGGKALASQYGIKAGSTTDLPSILIFSDDKKNPQSFNSKGSSKKRDVQSMLDAMMQNVVDTLQTRATRGTMIKTIKDKKKKRRKQDDDDDEDNKKKKKKKVESKVMQLNASNFDEMVYKNKLIVAVAFAAPWCGHCQKLHPEWEEAAQRLDGEGAVLGWVDATTEKELANQYKVKSFPTIYFFPGSEKSSKDAIPYKNGDRSAEGLVREILKVVDETGVVRLYQTPEMTSTDVLLEHCSGHNHICVLAALPHILDTGAVGREKYLDQLSNVYRKSFRGTSAFSFLWYEGGSQSKLENTLGLTFGFPAIVALSLDRNAYVVMRGSFQERGIATFLLGVTTGRQTTSQLPNGIELPTMITTVEPWDGSDGAPLEEEIPLSEIMGWDDEE